MSDYSTFTNILFCLNTQVDQPGRYWEQAIGGSPAVAGEFVRQLEMGIPNRRWQSADSGADNRRPIVVTGGGLRTGTHNGSLSRFMFFIDPLTGANDPCKVIHQNGILDLWISFETNAAMASDIGCILDSTNLNTTALGFYVVVSNGKLIVRVNNGTATPVVTMTSLENVNDNTRHLAHIRLNTGNGACSLRVDKSTRVYATQGSRSGGNVAFPLALGGRVGAQAANDFEGTLWGIAGIVGQISDANKATFLADNPYGNIVGWPEIACGNIHFNIRGDVWYCPTQLYFSGIRVSDATDADGAVYAWNNTSGWQGSGHGLEPNQPEEGGETLISCQARVDNGSWVDVADGDDIVGEEVATVKRVTTTVAFHHTHTMTTLADGTRLDKITLVKNGVAGDGGGASGVRTMYPIRNSRNPNFTQVRRYAADGTYLSEFTMTTSSGTLIQAANVIHIAQYDSVNKIVSCVVMRRGADTPGFRQVTIGVPQNMRNYQQVWYNENFFEVPEGHTITLESATLWATSTDGTWKAQADQMIADYLTQMAAEAAAAEQNASLSIGLGLEV